MPVINIDTTTNAYTRRVANLDDITGYIGPLLKHYQRLNEAEKRAWRQRDELLKAVLIFAKKVERSFKDD